jgi:hypothetical protein
MIFLRALGVIGFVVIVLFFNTGYVYRTKCPLPSGGTQTSWTFGIDDVIPYIRSTSAPCKSHTGTRLALNEVGVWPIHDGFSAASSSPVTQEDKAAAAALAKATAALSAEYTHERKLGAAIHDEIRAHGGYTAALRRRAFGLLGSYVAHLSRIKTGLDGSTRANDAELAETQRELSLFVAQQIAVNRAFLTSTSQAEAQRRSNAALSKIVPVVHRLQQLAPDVQAKYPNVNNWQFLPNA